MRVRCVIFEIYSYYSHKPTDCTYKETLNDLQFIISMSRTLQLKCDN